jgi:hypothetical protein
MKVHKIVAATWLGPPPPGATLIRHLDDNPMNWRPDNLAYGTQKDNSDDMRRNGCLPWSKCDPAPKPKPEPARPLPDSLLLRGLFQILASEECRQIGGEI